MSEVERQRDSKRVRMEGAIEGRDSTKYLRYIRRAVDMEIEEMKKVYVKRR